MNCLVIGAGIIGLSIADALCRSGHRVRLIDRRTTPQIASWAAGGILPPPVTRADDDPLERLRGLSHELYEDWCRELQAATGVTVPFDRCGGIYLGRTSGERIALQAAVAQWAAEGVKVERWNVQQLRRNEPGVSEPAESTPIYFLPDEIQVRPSRILRALHARLAQYGVMVESVQQAHWDFESPEGPTLQTSQGKMTADHYCLATGAWAPELLQPLGLNLPIEPRRGQMVLWQLDRVPLRHILNEGPRYLIARDDGHLLAGSTVEDVGFDGRTTTAAIAELVQFARSLLPVLAQVEPRQSWAGLRPWSPDATPFLGAVPGHPNISLATGHFRSGIHLAPATARLIQQLICGEQPELDLAPFSPRR